MSGGSRKRVIAQHCCWAELLWLLILSSGSIFDLSPALFTLSRSNEATLNATVKVANSPRKRFPFIPCKFRLGEGLAQSLSVIFQISVLLLQLIPLQLLNPNFTEVRQCFLSQCTHISIYNYICISHWSKWLIQMTLKMSLYHSCSSPPVNFPFPLWISSRHFSLCFYRSSSAFPKKIKLFPFQVFAEQLITMSYKSNDPALSEKQWKLLYRWERVSILIKCKIILITSNSASKIGLPFIQINEQTAQIPKLQNEMELSCLWWAPP